MLRSGNYIVTEGDDPAGFDFDASSRVTATGNGTGAQDATIEKQVNIAINSGGDTVTCTYVNDQQLGAIKIHKTIEQDRERAGRCGVLDQRTERLLELGETEADGTACVDGLEFGGYTVTELRRRRDSSLTTDGPHGRRR